MFFWTFWVSGLNKNVFVQFLLKYAQTSQFVLIKKKIKIAILPNITKHPATWRRGLHLTDNSHQRYAATYSWGWNGFTPITVQMMYVLVSATRSLAGRAECTTFLIFTKQLWVCLVIKGTGVMNGIWTHTLLLTTSELWSSKLNSLATFIDLNISFILAVHDVKLNEYISTLLDILKANSKKETRITPLKLVDFWLAKKPSVQLAGKIRQGFSLT